MQIHMTPDNVPTLSLPTLPAIFTTLGIPAPVLEVVSNPATGGSASWVVESTAEDGTTIPAHIEISTSVNGNTTFTARAKEGAAANANYTITAAAVTVKVGYEQPSWTVTIPTTAKVAEALTFAPANVPAGVTVSVACKNASDHSDASAALYKDPASGKYYFLKAGSYEIEFSSPVVTNKYAAQTETRTITVGKMPYTLAWMRDGKEINGTSILVKTAETNLPVLTKATIPAALSEKLVAPAVAITYNPADQNVLTFDDATGQITLTGKEAPVTISASIASDNPDFEGSASVTLDVSNARTYDWVNPGNGYLSTEKTGAFAMGEQTWNYSVEDVSVLNIGANMQLGANKKTSDNIYTLTNSSDYAGKLIKSISLECVTNSAGAPIRILTDGKEILSDIYSSTSSKFEWSLNAIVAQTLSIEISTKAYSYMRPTKLKIVYGEVTEGMTFVPGWDIVQSDTWTLGNSYNAPTAIKLPEGLSVTLTPNTDDILVAEDGKWYPKHAGEISFTASSPKEGKYEEKSVQVTFNVAKADYLLGWKLGEEKLTDKYTLKCLTTETNLPTVNVQRTLPDLLAEFVTYPEYTVSTTAPQTGDVATYSKENNAFTLTGTQGTQKFTVAISGDTNFNDATFDLTLNVDNKGQYKWLASNGNPEFTIGTYDNTTIGIGDQTWSFASSTPIKLDKYKGLKIGVSGGDKSNFTLTSGNAFAGKLIKSIVLNGTQTAATGGSPFDLCVLVDGKEVIRGQFKSYSSTLSLPTPVYCDENIQIVGQTGANETILFTGITIDYESNATVKTDPVWKVEDCKWTMGSEYALPSATNVQSGVTVTVAPKDVEADFFVTGEGENLKYAPKHAGTIILVASSAATDRYNARGPIEFKVNVPKLDYLLGWELDGKLLEDYYEYNCSTTDTNLPVLKVATLPAGISAPTLTTTYTTEGIVSLENLKLTPIAEGNTMIEVVLAENQNFNTASFTIDVTVADTPAVPTANVKNEEEIKIDFSIELTTTTTGAEIYYSINGGDEVLYSAPFTLPNEDYYDLKFRSKKGANYSDFATVTELGVLKYRPTLAFAEEEIKASILHEIPMVKLDISGELSTIEGHTPDIRYELKDINNAVYTAATIDANGQITLLPEAKDGDSFYVYAYCEENAWYIGSSQTNQYAMYSLTLSSEDFVTFDFTALNAYGMKTTDTGGSTTVDRKTITVGDVELYLEGTFIHFNGNVTDVRFYAPVSGATNLIKISKKANASYADGKIVKVEVQGANVLFDNCRLDGEVVREGELSMNPVKGAKIEKITVTLATPKSLYNLPDELTIPWDQIIDHKYEDKRDGAASIKFFPSEFNEYINTTFVPLFATNDFDTNMGEGCKGHDTSKEVPDPNYSDCCFSENYNEYTAIDANSFTLGVPCSGLYKLTVGLKEGTQCPIRYIPTTKEVTVKVIPSFNAALGGNNGAPLTFNWFATIDASNHVGIDATCWRALTRTMVQYHGEGTMTLWYKQEGEGIEYKGDETTDSSHPNYKGATTPEASPRRITSLPGQTVIGDEGTPVAGYTRYGADGIDFRKGADVNLIFQKNGVYTEPIHFVAYHSDDSLITGIDRVPTVEADAEYYTVDGLRLPSGENLQPGMYVKRQGSKASLVIIR